MFGYQYVGLPIVVANELTGFSSQATGIAPLTRAIAFTLIAATIGCQSKGSMAFLTTAANATLLSKCKTGFTPMPASRIGKHSHMDWLGDWPHDRQELAFIAAELTWPGLLCRQSSTKKSPSRRQD